MEVPLAYFCVSLAWPVLAAALFWYVSRRCSSERLLFWDGLLYVNVSVSIGWVGISLFLGFFGVLIALIASALIAVYDEIRRNPENTKVRFLHLISFFYATEWFNRC
jgi:hypothetical protein